VQQIHGCGYAGTGVRVRRYGYGRQAYTGAGMRAAAGITGFFQKKNWPALLKPVPIYPPILRHGYGYRARVHGYGLYPTGFSKPLLGTTENESGRAKHENGTRRPRYCRKWLWERKTWKVDPTSSVPSKMSPGAENMKRDSDALGTVVNKSEIAKHENGTRRQWYRQKLRYEYYIIIQLKLRYEYFITLISHKYYMIHSNLFLNK
jgi:hypothetical protein